MHRLLRRQLKKIGYEKGPLSDVMMGRFLALVDQAYQDSDEDRALLENILSISSKEMQGLYEELKERSQGELAKSEERYRRLVENVHEHYFFYTHGIDGVFTYVSESIYDVLGYQPEDFLQHFSTYLTDDPINEYVYEYTDQAIGGEVHVPYELGIYHKDGSVRYLEITEVPVIDEYGVVETIEGIARDITEQYKAKIQISHLAKHDTLTGIANRLSLEEQLNNLLARSKRQEQSFAMLFLDLDRFKQINDTLGHDIGDRLLQQVAKRIRPNIREEDIFARIGGDEFIIVLTDIDEIYLTVSIRKIMDLMREVWDVDAYELKVSTSMGVALYPQDGETTVDLMKNADIAMYRAKALGRDNFSFFTDELNEMVHEEMRLEQDMATAFDQQQFVLFYQPKLDMSTDRVVGSEALIRWRHPTLGLIDTEKFITIAENTGFIMKLGRWVIEEGCRSLERVNKISDERIHLSINVSTRQFQHGDLFMTIKEALKNSGADPSLLSIEITESLMLERDDDIIDMLVRIRALGVRICLDDFGTGYSSLSYLHRMPIDAIKIDKSFVDEISRDATKVVLLDTIIAMGKSLEMVVIAEGVESESQRAHLMAQGCDLYQGFLYSEPLDEESYFVSLR